MKKILLVLCISTTIIPLFDYDRAVGLAQKEQWQDAGKQFNMLVAERPDSPELLYDAGVVAFNNEDYQQAKAYFESVVQKNVATRILKEQTYFNKGNTHVALQELKEALLSYEQVLMLNADNELAQHNHEMVKKMLEQQEQQQDQQDPQNQDPQNQDQQNKQCEQDSDKEQDGDKDSKGKDQQGGNQDQSSGDGSQGSQDSQDTQRDDQEQESQQDSRDDNRLDQDSDKQNQQEGGPNKQKEKPEHDKQRDEGGNSDQSTKETEQEQQREQQDDHQLPFDKQGDEQDELQQQDMQEQQKEQEMGQEQADVSPLDPKHQQVLAKRSDRDARLNKELVKAFVSQEMKGQDGQNCW